MFIHTIRSLIANIYLIETKGGVVIVDAGFNNAADEVLLTLDQLGHSPKDVRLIFLTHAHMDHIGSAAELRRRTGASIAMHRADVGKVNAGHHNMPTGRGWMGKLVEYGFNGLGARYHYEAFAPDILVEQGMSLRVFGLDATVVETPGHTLGSVSLDLGDGVMVIGDAMINQFRVGMPLYGEDNPLAYDSLRKVHAHRPRILYSGHGVPFSGNDLTQYFEIKSLSPKRNGKRKGQDR